MSLAESLLPEFDHEMELTRNYLLRIPTEKLAFQPHQKSMTLGHLVTHITNIPTWVNEALEKSSFDVAPKGGANAVPNEIASSEEAVATFDANVKSARLVIVKSADDVFQQPWTLLSGGHKVFTMPKIAVLRTFVMNHLIHHRAQLGVYFRLNDVSVPSTYGPSADEGRL